MRKTVLVTIALLAATLILTGCLNKPYVCSDPMGCVTVGNGQSVQMATLLTTSGPDQAYGIDAVRGVEIAVSDKQTLLGHPIELVKVDDLCTEAGGQQGATQLAANPQIVGVIGTSCSSATVPAAKILTDAHMVLISPSSTAPSLTDPATHQAGFLRTIYNDKAQGQSVAQFAFNVLGARRMVTIHDGTAYPKQLQQAACDSFQQLGGECILQIDLSTGQALPTALQNVAPQNPDVIYFPLYTDDGVNAMRDIPQAGFANVALISSDGLLSSDFLQKAGPGTEGMYLSGPADVKESTSFTQKYKSRYGEDPIASYHLQAYDAATMLFTAIEHVAVQDSSQGNGIAIPRQALLNALFGTRGMQGLSGPLTCSPTGDCAQPNIDIFQVVNKNFKVIYP